MHNKSVPIFFIVVILLNIQNNHAHSDQRISKRGLMDNINNGIKYAGQMFGINTASDVANLVSRAFSQNSSSKKQDISGALTQMFNNNVANTNGGDFENHSPMGTSPGVNPSALLSGMLRMIGFDTGKLGALALNAIIMIAQMIGNAFTPKRSANDGPIEHQYTDDMYENEQPISYDRQSGEQNQNQRQARGGTPFDWMMENPSGELTKLMIQARDRKLPEYLTDMISKLETRKGDGECIKMLLCKSSPFIWGMQKSLKDQIDVRSGQRSTDTNNAVDHSSAFFQYLPNLTEYRKHGRFCEQRYSDYCNVTKA